MPPKFLFFDWTLENYADRAGALELSALRRRIRSSCRSARRWSRLLFAIPAAWAMAFAPAKRTKDMLMWMLSTKMMPPVGVLVPIYLIFRDFGPARHRVGLDRGPVPAQPADHGLDALHLLQGDPARNPRGRAHGRRPLWKEIVYVLAPMAVPGIASTLLLNVILAWNEAFWTLEPDDAKAAPLTAFIASYSSPEGLFWAKLRPPRPWRSRRSWSSAGSARSNSSAA